MTAAGADVGTGAGRSEPAGWLRKIVEAILPPWMEDASYLRLARMAYVVRVLVGVTALAVVPVIDATNRQRLILALLISLVYLPYAVALFLVSRKTQAPWVRIATFAGDLLVVFMFQAVVPPTRFVALFGYLMIQAYYVYAGGLLAGAVVGVAAVALTMAAKEIGTATSDNDAYTLTMFVAVMASLAFLLDAVGREQRRATQRLQQLHDSLRDVASSLEVREVLDSVAAAAKESLAAAFAAILMRESEDLLAATVQGLEVSDDLSQLTEAAMATPDAGPSAVALSTGEPVVVQDFASHPQFRRWAKVGERLGFRSMIAAPLLAEGRPIGVLNVYLAEPGKVDREAVDLVSAFAQQAAGAIARAVAFERERTAAQRLRDLDRMKAEFLATVSHELRTPLTAIQGFAETMLEKWEALDEPDRLDYLRRIARNAGELRELIEQLLDLSRFDAARVEVHPKEVGLARFVRSCVEAYAPVIGDREVRIAVPEELEARADPHGLERILSNLLSNAAKFSPPGTPIAVGARADDSEVVVWVKDAGVGIPRGELVRIFDPFYRVDGEAATTGGTGIGLSVAKRYTELHGGRIWAVSVPGGGSTFLFTLPRPGWTRRPTAAAEQALGSSDLPDGEGPVVIEPPAEAARPAQPGGRSSR